MLKVLYSFIFKYRKNWRGQYLLKIYNNSGQQVYSQRFNHGGGAINQSIVLPASLKAGMYTMQLESELNKVMSKSFMIQ